MKIFLIGAIISTLVVVTTYGQTTVYGQHSKVTVEGMTDSIFDVSTYAGQCMNGDKHMCGEYAMDYLYGGEKDRITEQQAITIFTKGCRLGNQSSCKILKSLKK